MNRPPETTLIFAMKLKKKESFILNQITWPQLCMNSSEHSFKSVITEVKMNPFCCAQQKYCIIFGKDSFWTLNQLNG